MHTSRPDSAAATADAFEARWARWQQAGAAQARLWDRRAGVTAALAFCAVAAWLALAVYWN